MIKTLMAMIREFVTRGVTTLVLRFTKEGGTRNDERRINRVARRVSRQLKGGELLGRLCRFSFHAWVTEHFDDSDHVALIT
jgi:ATP-dependent Lon protease